MQRLFGFVLLAALGWLAYTRTPHHAAVADPGPFEAPAIQPAASSADQPLATQAGTFSCDGRRYCSEMHSCAEATYFLRNCPDTRMDGDHDGIPCERQWCPGDAR